MTHLRRATVRPRPQPARAAIVLAAGAALVLGVVPLAQADAVDPAGSHVTITGTVERVTPDHFGAEAAAVHESDEVQTFVRTTGDAVRVESPALAKVATGSTVSVDVPARELVAASEQAAAPASASRVEVLAGVPAGEVAVGSGSTATDAAVAAGDQPHEVLVVVADLPGQTRSSKTAADIARTVNGGVNAYWSTVTDGRVRFRATAYSGTTNGHVRTSTEPCSGGGTFPFWDEVAAKTGFTAGAGRHLLVYFAPSPACDGVAGLATLGGNEAGGDLSGGGSVWSNGYDTVSVLGHELGHNLGLGHSQELRCGHQVDDRLGRCEKHIYNDLSDIMGVSWGNNGYLNPVHLQRLGLLAAGDVVDVTTSRTLTLRPLASGSGLRVAAVRAGGATYLVSARARVGLDSWIRAAAGSYVRPGVTIRKVLDRGSLSSADADAYPSRESLLLDGSPSTADTLTGPKDYRTELPVGGWVSLASGRFSLRVDSVSQHGATVRFQLGARPAEQAAGASTAQAAMRRGSLERHGALLRFHGAWRWTVTRPGAVTAGHAKAVVAAGKNTWRTNRFSTVVKASGGKAHAHGTLKVAGTVRARYLRETAASFSGRWRTARTSQAIGGSERIARHDRAAAEFHVSGRSVGVVARKAPHRGRLAVYVDGVRRAVVRLGAHRNQGPAVVWRKNFAGSGPHVVTLVRLGPKRVGFDGLVVLR